ncbi:hypothetical protein IE53DRAFT_385119 [Violaceomyces palustris]|uniref:Uncharacterized protein n=1 Tax=Violaceomyces palustris TaxID=1673888 RepID=A0ACD0P2X9_9BASI|nr:hypothetical protein IE53DRAFT_385119 [Violaceomyces palustris]
MDLSTPSFRASQDHRFVRLRIHCPAAKTQKCVVVAHGNIFGFHLDPYYLPLVLPGPVQRQESNVDPSASSASFETESSTVEIVLEKCNPGEHFQGLESIQPKILPDSEMEEARKDSRLGKGLFANDSSCDDEGLREVARKMMESSMMRENLHLEGKMEAKMVEEEEEGMVEKGEFKTQPFQQGVSSHPAEPGEKPCSKPGFGYGYLSRFHGPLLVGGITDTRNLLEVDDPDRSSVEQRMRSAEANEDSRWDEGRYLDNFVYEDEQIQDLMAWKSPLVGRVAPSSSSSLFEAPDASRDDQACLLLQIHYASCYDQRTTLGDPTVESGWTISSLSRCMTSSYLESQSDDANQWIQRTVRGSIRRSLTYPLYRHWRLSLQVLQDLIHLLSSGRSKVVESLVEVSQRLEESTDGVMVRLNQVWIQPLISEAFQQDQQGFWSDETLEALSNSVTKVKERMTKMEVGGEEWDLEVIEEAARQAQEDGEGGFI